MLLRRSLAAIVILAACLAISISRAADDKAATPAAPAEKPVVIRLVKPWSDLSSLSDEQKEKIHEIHTKFLDDRKALEKKQHDDIVALLNDDQKKELMKVENAAKASNRPKPAAPDATEEKKN